MDRKRRLAAALITIALLTACASTGNPRRDAVRNQETAGALIGGVIGGVIGHQFGDGRGQDAMTILGAATGALIGGRLARDRAISRYEQEAAYLAFESTPSGRPVPWHDPDGYSQGRYVPMRTWRNTSGRYCREYQQIVIIDGREQRAYGTACRQSDGSWRVMDGGAR